MLQAINHQGWKWKNQEMTLLVHHAQGTMWYIAPHVHVQANLTALLEITVESTKMSSMLAWVAQRCAQR